MFLPGGEWWPIGEASQWPYEKPAVLDQLLQKLYRFVADSHVFII